MKKLFLDTNFILDYLIREEYKSLSQHFLEEAAKQGYKFYVSYLSVANFAYIERKLPLEQLKEKLRFITEIFEVICNNRNQIRKALNFVALDFEDILQYQAAIDAKCDVIITRNEKDFKFSEIPVYAPSTFLKLFLEK